MAAALANVDTKDDWKTHFKDTILGGKMLNNWKMPYNHAHEAPDCVYELEQWGAVFDRTPRREDYAEDFRRSYLEETCPRRGQDRP